jgi:predicted NBD/HSP70 family sugar kinase
MTWINFLWPMVTGACLTLALINLRLGIAGPMRAALEFQISNQYTVQGDLFSKSIRQGTELPVTLEGSVRNMAVIEALFRSGKSDRWETPAVPA